MLHNQQTTQSLLCKTYSKLKYYDLFKNFYSSSVYLEKPLSFIQRKNFSRAIFGVLPINEELLRYCNPMVPANKRYCDICLKISNLTQTNTKHVENLEHCCFVCPEYSDIRTHWLRQLITPDNFNSLPAEDKFSIIFNTPNNVKPTAIFITSFLNKHSLFMKKYKIK